MIIIIQCIDEVGLVAAISGLLAKQELNIISMHEHVDNTANLFFMRLEVDGASDANDLQYNLQKYFPKGR
jgi:formyltetrahydrofolate deformylase